MINHILFRFINKTILLSAFIIYTTTQVIGREFFLSSFPVNFLGFKGTESVNANAPPCKDGSDRFTTVP